MGTAPRKGHAIALLSLSLALLVTLAVLWARGRTHGQVVALFADGGRVSGVVFSRGQVFVVMTNLPLDGRRAWTIEAREVSDEDAQSLLKLLAGRVEYEKRFGRFGWERGKIDEMPGAWFVAGASPLWLPIALLAIPPALWLRGRLVLHRRARRGLCLACGYDLRATLGRCPECGWERPTEVQTGEIHAARHHSAGA
ncbi:MAG TPA: hypothetical protein VH475_00445 [Tepidisphaeraceae bacterium]|jgi:hypothetical protein